MGQVSSLIHDLKTHQGLPGKKRASRHDPVLLGLAPFRRTPNPYISYLLTTFLFLRVPFPGVLRGHEHASETRLVPCLFVACTKSTPGWSSTIPLQCTAPRPSPVDFLGPYLPSEQLLGRVQIRRKTPKRGCRHAPSDPHHHHHHQQQQQQQQQQLYNT
ncbi:hypothetical protein PLESTB_000170400 [Pleodorina starrii]|uniref:Uncharacterized protein n=1 Tax=Pleodorina starrii TaxID=330485 RepID=A0A9W6EXJ0_9CHLO|nr:hypothetical protein PLESTB_000170400 [Pleodorina starrii]